MSNKKMRNSSRKLFSRQWGTEHQMSPLPNINPRSSSGTIAFSRISIVLTMFFWVMYVLSVIVRQLIDGPQSYKFTMESFGYLITVTFLIFSALIYLITRQGALQRFNKHIRVPRIVLDKHFSKHKSPITVLIPSYNEEPEVIRKTMLSAALQEYPDIRIILLIDNDPFSADAGDVAMLESTYALTDEIQKILSEPYKRSNETLSQVKKNISRNSFLDKDVILKVSSEYIWAAKWLDELAKKEIIEDHVDVFFADQVLRELAKELELTGKALATLYKDDAKISTDRILQLCRRLVWIFKADLGIFERKRYASLSHEPNKAMNLNSYIGLMGGVYQQDETASDTILTSIKKQRKKSDMIIRDSEFVLTLDADSILLRDYCLRLVYLLQQPNNADVAVVQTPYSSFRGALSRIERLSGATTDIQHLIHQGMSYYNATFWVGANAVIRKRALEDIVEKEWVGGFEIKRYVQDHTVIEDTESSIDLALYNWRLVNYPERLSYSATPPDFGSLVIQRRRWANGGLLILPKLWTLIHKRKNKGKPISKMELMIRLNYMASIAWSNIGLVFLLAYPYDGRLLSPLVLLASIPYFVAMAIDLKNCRYKYSDIVRIYGFNLILLPVNIAGTLKSLQQALTVKKTPFARTPKVKNRTMVALPYVISPLLIIAFSLFTLWRNIQGENWGNATFAGFNATASLWATFSYIGIKNLFVDIWLGLIDLLYINVPSEKLAKQTDKIKNEVNWKGVLYYGEENKIIPHEVINEKTK